MTTSDPISGPLGWLSRIFRLLDLLEKRIEKLRLPYLARYLLTVALVAIPILALASLPFAIPIIIQEIWGRDVTGAVLLAVPATIVLRLPLMLILRKPAAAARAHGISDRSIEVVWAGICLLLFVALARMLMPVVAFLREIF